VQVIHGFFLPSEVLR